MKIVRALTLVHVQEKIARIMIAFVIVTVMSADIQTATAYAHVRNVIVIPRELQ